MVHKMFSNYFIPHGHCYLWKPGLVGLHILSDALIAVRLFFDTHHADLYCQEAERCAF